MYVRKTCLVLVVLIICSRGVYAQEERKINSSDTTLVKFLNELISEKENETKLFAEKIQEYERIVEQMKGAYDKTMYDLGMLRKRKEAFESKSK